MYKRGMSGQKLTIVILMILLIGSIVFGVVFAYFNTQALKSTGRIVMGDLNIKLVTGADSSGKSNLTFSNTTNIVGGSKLNNTALIVNNSSEVPMYLVVVYSVKASKNGQDVDDPMTYSILDLNSDYYNPSAGISKPNSSVNKSSFIDYVFTTSNDGVTRQYRCMVSLYAHQFSVTGSNQIKVIEENIMGLSLDIGNEYQETTMSFQFQAYAIVADPTKKVFNTKDPIATQCQDLVNEIYKSQNYQFLV